MARALLTSLMFFTASFAFSQEIVYPDFTISTMREGKSSSNYEKVFIRKQEKGDFSNTRYLEIFRNIYARNIILSKDFNLNYSPRIPHIIHQIWLGSPLPEKYLRWIRSWTNWNGWEYKLWTDKDVKTLNLYNQDLYNLAANYGEKSDILRLEILLKYGGLYIDVDYECIKPEFFEELHQCYDFYMGFEPLEHGLLDGYGMFKVCNALLASAPGHQLLMNFIVNMKHNCLVHAKDWTVEKTGPAYLTREIIAYEENHPHSMQRNMYLPSTFFYPISEPEIRACATRNDISSRIFPETAAVHYWSGSWINRDTWEAIPTGS